MTLLSRIFTNTISEFALLLYFLLISYSLGNTIFKKLSADNLPEKIVFSIGVGYGILATLTFALGVGGYLYVGIFWAIFLILGVVYFKDIKNFFLSLKGTVGPKGLRWWELTGYIFLILSFAFYLLKALVPDFDWDALAYHIADPKIYLQKHKIIHLPYSSYCEMPSNCEMLYTLGLMLKSEIFSNLINSTTSILTSLAIYTMGKKFFNPLAGLLGAIIFSSLVLTWELTTGPWIDSGLAYFVMLTIYAFLNYAQGGKNGWLWLSALFCGLACGTKLTALALVIIMLFWVFVSTKSKSLLTTITYAIIVVVACAHWYIKSAIYTGNPVYPFYTNIFGGSEIDTTFAKEVTDFLQSGYRAGNDLIGLLKLPYTLIRYGDTKFKLPMHYLTIPFFLLVGSAILFYRTALCNRTLWRLLLFCFLFTLPWFFIIGQEMRFLYPISPFLCLIVSHIAIEFVSSRKPLLILISLIIIMPISYRSWYKGRVLLESMPLACGLESREEFVRSSSVGHLYRVCEYINKNAPPDARILLSSENRGYFLDREYTWEGNRIILHYIKNLDEFSDPADYFNQLKRQKIMYLLQVSNRMYKVFDFSKFVGKYLELEYHDESPPNAAVNIYLLK